MEKHTARDNSRAVQKSDASAILFQNMLLFHALGDPYHNAGQADQSNQVGQSHHRVEEVGQVPHQVHLQQRANKDTQDHDDGVDIDRLLTKEVLDVLLAEEVPTNDGGEGKAAQCHRREDGLPRRRRSW